MYLTFYGLNEKPFTTTPDPRFLYLTPGHREALAHLVYGVQESMGFLVLTGEVGTGKTTLLHALRHRLEGNAAVAFLVNSGLSFDGILEHMLEDFGILRPDGTRAQRLLALQRFLVERGRAGENVVFILDEAHHLDPGTLEHIRLLSNFESPTQKLLQIVLAGQPELKLKLNLPELHQLKQRIALRAVLPALSPQETREYIRRRLSFAGARDFGLFTERAISRIAEYAQGIPRTVNIVCDHCLLIGYADQTRYLDVDIVKQAVRYFEDGTPPRNGPAGVSWRRWWPPRGFHSYKSAVRLDNGPRRSDIERPTGAVPVTPVLVPVEHHSSVGGGGERGLPRRQAVAVGLAVVALGGLVLVGSGARRWGHSAPLMATVVAPNQPELSKATGAPPPQPGMPTATVVTPPQPELPKATVAPEPGMPSATVVTPSQPELPKATVAPSRQREFSKAATRSQPTLAKTTVAPRQRELPKATVALPRQRELSQTPVVSPSQPELAPSTVQLPAQLQEEIKTVDTPVPLSAGVPEAEPRPSKPGANSVDPPRAPARPASDKAPLQSP